MDRLGGVAEGRHDVSSLQLIEAAQLNRARRDNVTLGDALKDGPHDGATVIAWSPNEVIVAAWDDRKWANHAGAEVNLGDCFEARSFNANEELRWLARGDGTGTAVLVSELALSTDERWTPVTTEPVEARVDGVRYLAFGSGAGTSNGWTTLSSARLGHWFAPVAATGSDRHVALAATEYVARGAEGNAVVIDERFIGWVSQPALRSPRTIAARSEEEHS
jgi:CRISPR-associated protein (TIGR03984 family)